MTKQKFIFTEEFKQSPENARTAVKQLYEQLSEESALNIKTSYTKDTWRMYADTHKIFFSPAQVKLGEWSLFVTDPSYSAEVERKDVYKLCKRKGEAFYRKELIKSYWQPKKLWDDDEHRYTVEYYAQSKYTFWQAVKHLREIENPEANEIAELFRESYFLYEHAYDKADLKTDMVFNMASNYMMCEALERYQEATRRLYKYNRSFSKVEQDVRIKVRDLNFVEYVKRAKGIDLNDTDTPAKSYTAEEIGKAIYAAAVFDCGYTTKELQDIINKHPETYTFLEWCNIPELGIADYTDFGTPIYHKLKPGDKPNLFTAVGRKEIEIFKDELVDQLITCYDFYMSLSEEDREPYYKRWVDAQQVTHIVRNWNDVMEQYYPDDKCTPQYRDFLSSLYDEDDDDAPTNNKCGKYVNAEASVMYLFDSEEDDELIDITDMVEWIGDEDTETPQVTVCGKLIR